MSLKLREEECKQTPEFEVEWDLLLQLSPRLPRCRFEFSALHSSRLLWRTTELKAGLITFSNIHFFKYIIWNGFYNPTSINNFWGLKKERKGSVMCSCCNRPVDEPELSVRCCSQSYCESTGEWRRKLSKRCHCCGYLQPPALLKIQKGLQIQRGQTRVTIGILSFSAMATAEVVERHEKWRHGCHLSVGFKIWNFSFRNEHLLRPVSLATVAILVILSVLQMFDQL